MKPTRRYHHGDLRASLLREAGALLNQDGVDGLSLRRLAERTGVSRSAPYHYFKDKQSLLCALAAEGFLELDALIDEELTEEALAAELGRFVRDYLNFAVEQPERYDLMFGRRLWKQGTPTPELKQVAYATFRRYARRIAALSSSVGERQALRIAQASWATLHGLCRLLIDGIYVDTADMQEVSDIAVGLLFQAMNTSVVSRTPS